jgi:hypothetical protein
MIKWNANLITSELSKHFFKNKNLILVPNSYWTGEECDLLVVTQSLKIIDVEIKISKKDFIADKVKSKWYIWDRQLRENKDRDWPKHVWKHFFCMPKAIWDDSMYAKLPSEMCGVILIEERKDGTMEFDMIKNAKSNSKAKQLDASDAIDIARLASIRMWRAVEQVHMVRKLREENGMLQEDELTG